MCLEGKGKEKNCQMIYYSSAKIYSGTHLYAIKMLVTKPTYWQSSHSTEDVIHISRDPQLIFPRSAEEH